MAAALRLLPLLALSGCLSSCTHSTSSTQASTAQPLIPSASYAALPAENPLRGDFIPVHDPSLTRAPDGTWAVYTTDLPFLHSDGYLVTRCSPDLITWHRCGQALPAQPAWVRSGYPDAVGLWAPDVSYFGGKWHLYYSVSSLGSQNSAIGMATSPTLGDWQDGGPILLSQTGDDFNAIDPNVFLDNGRVWLNYGSYWGGIYQQELDTQTGKPVPGGTRYHLAEQAKSQSGALEGAAMVAHNGWYYLFASQGICCAIPIDSDDYRQIVGRSRSVHGPFLAQDGIDMLKGGGTVLLQSDANWLAPGGGSLWQSPDGGETLLAFHALHRSENGALHLWIERVGWENDWPVLGPITP